MIWPLRRRAGALFPPPTSLTEDGRRKRRLRGENKMSVIEIILIGFIAATSLLGASSVFVRSRT
jgi:hypothetical protein